MNEKLKQEKFEKEMDIKDKRNRHKAKVAKKQQAANRPLFDLTLKIIDEAVSK